MFVAQGCPRNSLQDSVYYGQSIFYELQMLHFLNKYFFTFLLNLCLKSPKFTKGLQCFSFWHYSDPQMLNYINPMGRGILSCRLGTAWCFRWNISMCVKWYINCFVSEKEMGIQTVDFKKRTGTTSKWVSEWKLSTWH